MEGNQVRLAAIVDWKMKPSEGDAYRLAVMYETEFLRMFRGSTEVNGQVYKRNTIPQKTDPRKSYLFRHCWKLRRETRGLLKEEEYKLYIIANLQILKINNARIDPIAICGNKAWIRWKMWKRWYDKKSNEVNADAAPSVDGVDPRIIKQIDKTKKFIFETYGGEPTFEKINESIKMGSFKIWVKMNKVSLFYVVLSPFVSKSCDIDKMAKECFFDKKLINNKLSQQIIDYFRHEYNHEFI